MNELLWFIFVFFVMFFILSIFFFFIINDKKNNARKGSKYEPVSTLNAYYISRKIMLNNSNAFLFLIMSNRSFNSIYDKFLLELDIIRFIFDIPCPHCYKII